MKLVLFKGVEVVNFLCTSWQEYVRYLTIDFGVTTFAYYLEKWPNQQRKYPDS